MRLRRALGCLFCAFLWLARPSAAAPGLTEIVERFDHLEVGDAFEVSGQTLAAGRFTARLASGRLGFAASPVSTAALLP